MLKFALAMRSGLSRTVVSLPLACRLAFLLATLGLSACSDESVRVVGDADAVQLTTDGNTTGTTTAGDTTAGTTAGTTTAGDTTAGTTTVGGTTAGETTGGTDTDSGNSSGVISLNAAHREASRFLAQATFGPRLREIRELAATGDYQGWIRNQLNLPASTTIAYTRANSNGSFIEPRHHVWWDNALSGSDQLRQRVAFALSQIFVVSDLDFTLSNAQWGMSLYYDMLINHAFGNYRELLEAVTLSPVMGTYLSMVQNEKADPARNIRPDENYAREVLQLFSIGLYQLDIQGREIPEGNPQAAYSQKTVEEFARVFTGWTYPTADFFQDGSIFSSFFESNMVPDDAFHDQGSKELLNGTVLPAGQGTVKDLEDALDNIFNHPNVGPFIGRQLIQRLVTSNPSPGYIERVARVFNNNGQGVRGDLAAVIEAILLDDEARNGHTDNPEFGKIREPAIKLSHFFRALDGTPGPESNGVHATGDQALYRLDEMLGQAPMRSKSVFNFYLPNHPVAPGSDFTAPEMAILTETNMAATHNNYHHQIYRFNNRSNLSDDNPRVTIIDLEPLADIAANTDDLLDWYDLVLLGGEMPASVRETLKRHINGMPSGASGRFARVQDSLFLMVNSAAFNIQR